jgi:hypothetical protein
MDFTEHVSLGPRAPFMEFNMSHSVHMHDTLFYRHWAMHSQIGPIALCEPLPMMKPLGPFSSSV